MTAPNNNDVRRIRSRVTVCLWTVAIALAFCVGYIIGASVMWMVAQ